MSASTSSLVVPENSLVTDFDIPAAGTTETGLTPESDEVSIPAENQVDELISMEDSSRMSLHPDPLSLPGRSYATAIQIDSDSEDEVIFDEDFARPMIQRLDDLLVVVDHLVERSERLERVQEA
jgi:hypothetical protein